MDFTKIKEKINTLPGGLMGAFPKILAVLSNFISNSIGIVRSSAEKALDRIPKEKRHFVLIGFGGVFLILIVVSVLLVNSGKSKEKASPAITAGLSIPFEELFIPGEPDFIPAYLPEREPRSSWSHEEIRPFWRNPDSTGLWRDVVKAAVDSLMEGVP